jgi:hypothetical protein
MTGDKTVFLITTQNQLVAVSPNATLGTVTSSSNNAAPCSFGMNIYEYLSRLTSFTDTSFFLNRGPSFPVDPILSLNTSGLGSPVLYGSHSTYRVLFLRTLHDTT